MDLSGIVLIYTSSEFLPAVFCVFCSLYCLSKLLLSLVSGEDYSSGDTCLPLIQICKNRS